jgi:hypothetical protein
MGFLVLGGIWLNDRRGKFAKYKDYFRRPPPKKKLFLTFFLLKIIFLFSMGFLLAKN